MGLYMMNDIFSVEDVFSMLDSFFDNPAEHWDGFYSEGRANGIPIPFFVDAPDENLVEYFGKGILTSGRALELGCGPGRNATFLTEKGYSVDAVDISQEAIAWARQRARAKNLNINFICDSIFNVAIEPSSYDLVYDSGCLHHFPPHRRITYVELLKKALKPNGFFALTCFVPGRADETGGENITDRELYERRNMRGGIGYTEEKLVKIFAGDFDIVEFRRMKDVAQSTGLFGKSFLWAAIFRRKQIA